MVEPTIVCIGVPLTINIHQSWYYPWTNQLHQLTSPTRQPWITHIHQPFFWACFKAMLFFVPLDRGWALGPRKHARPSARLCWNGMVEWWFNNQNWWFKHPTWINMAIIQDNQDMNRLYDSYIMIPSCEKIVYSFPWKPWPTPSHLGHILVIFFPMWACQIVGLQNKTGLT